MGRGESGGIRAFTAEGKAEGKEEDRGWKAGQRAELASGRR